MKMINYLRWKYHLAWDPPSEYVNIWNWVFCIWNEYDDWLYNGVHGFRVLGLNIGMVSGLLDRLFWKILPVVRFINRRPERRKGG